MKQLKFTCDRCGQVKEEVLTVDLPKGWYVVNTKALCSDCWRDLDTFLRGARIDHVAVVRSSDGNELREAEIER